MTDDSEVGRLPQFARDVAVLARGPPPGRGAERGDHGVLPPFSGVLDVHVVSGQVPTLDLSYLTLGLLVVPGVAHSRGRTRDSSATDSDPDGRSGGRRDATSDEGRELTVREVISARGDADRVRDAPDRSSAVLDDTPRTHLDPGTGRADRRGDAPDAPSRERPGSDAPFDAPVRTTVDRSGADGSPDDPAGDASGPPPTRTPSAQTEDDPGSTPGANGRRSTGADDRTPATPAGPPIPSLGGVAPPRMLTRWTEPTEGGRRASGPDTTGVAPPRMISERPAASTDADRSPSDAPDRDGRSGPRGNAPGDAGATGRRPRMVVDHGSAAERRAGDRGGDSAAPNDGSDSSTDGTDDGRRESSGRADNSEERLAAVVEASTDPESRLVDSLYRALREREAIERRRRGGR